MTRKPLKDFILAWDFDGTIYANAHPLIGSRIAGMKELINFFYYEGFPTIIWTCRNGQTELNAIKQLADDGIHYDRINQNCQYTVDFFEIESVPETRKISYDILIDDRNIGGLMSVSSMFQCIEEAWRHKLSVGKFLQPVYIHGYEATSKPEMVQLELRNDQTDEWFIGYCKIVAAANNIHIEIQNVGC